jgi:hypothetical protein
VTLWLSDSHVASIGRKPSPSIHGIVAIAPKPNACSTAVQTSMDGSNLGPDASVVA